MSNLPSEEQFLEANAQPVYNLALRLVGNPSDAEDLAQDALIRALQALPKFRGESSTTTWVYRITVNTWKNRVRSEKRRSFWKTLPLSLFLGADESEPEMSLPDGEPPLDQGLETEESARAVHEALMTLDAESRAVVVLRDIKGQSYQEIAQALDLPEGTVKSRISRAREALKRRLKSFVESG
ncbi:MAG: sigma-70 family RNA polymerase sigma factor [Elusimicrobiota bacterium]